MLVSQSVLDNTSAGVVRLRRFTEDGWWMWWHHNSKMVPTCSITLQPVGALQPVCFGNLTTEHPIHEVLHPKSEERPVCLGQPAVGEEE